MLLSECHVPDEWEHTAVVYHTNPCVAVRFNLPLFAFKFYFEGLDRKSYCYLSVLTTPADGGCLLFTNSPSPPGIPHYRLGCVAEGSDAH